MTEHYAAEIVDGQVVRVLVGDAQWCHDNLGGFWVDSDVLVGIGWEWDPVEGFIS